MTTNVDFLQSLVDQISLAVGRCEMEINALKHEHMALEDGLTSGFQRLSNRFEQLDQSAASKSAFNSYVVSAEKKDSLVDEELKSLRKSVRSLTDQVGCHADKISGHECSFEAHKAVLESLDQDMGSQEAVFSGKLQDVASLLDAKNTSLAKDVLQQLADFKVEMRGSPSTLENTKKELLEKFENVAMDSANAVLRSNILDSQFRSLDRKVENILIQLKKLEIK